MEEMLVKNEMNNHLTLKSAMNIMNGTVFAVSNILNIVEELRIFSAIHDSVQAFLVTVWCCAPVKVTCCSVDCTTSSIQNMDKWHKATSAATAAKRLV